jgi:two-component system response regulator RpaA
VPTTPSVLIVDDDPVIQLLLRVNFEMDGFKVATADEGESGLQMATDLLPDLVLLDVMMPKLDGYQVLEALRAAEATRELPVVLLSAKSLDSDRQAGLDAGANAYITKPFDPRKLLAEVKRYVGPIE